MSSARKRPSRSSARRARTRLSRPWTEPVKSSLRSPIHVTGRREAARRPQHQHPFRIENVLHAEAAADVGNADAKFFPADAKHTVGEQVADRVRAGGRGGQVQTAARSIELPHRTARLQRSCDDAVVDELAFHDMGGVADHGFDRADLAAVELERDIAPRLRPDRWGVRQNGVRDRDHRRQRRIVDDDSLGGIARGLSAFRDHECDRLADIANDVARQRVTGRHHQRRGHRDSWSPRTAAVQYCRRPIPVR